MYINKIDNIIDKILDNLYLLIFNNNNNNIIYKIINDKKINIIEYYEQINNFIDLYIKEINIDEIKILINNKDNLIKIIDIIKRYIAYYIFLLISYYYEGSIKDFRNNIIQYSKLQETSKFKIKNFFDTENNYSLINYFKIIKDSSKIILMTELQKKTLNLDEFRTSIIFLNNLGKDYVNNFLLKITEDKNEEKVVINIHNLIKTIVFGEIYQNQEKNIVFQIINDIEEKENEYIYIDIVVTNDEDTEIQKIQELFIGNQDMEKLSKDLYDLVNDNNKLITYDIDKKINNLIEYNFIIPIVDDFLRYHRDTELLDVNNEKNFMLPLINKYNAKNIQLVLMQQQRKKKENTKAQLIINKIDIISDLYSENIKNRNEIQNEIKKYFQNSLSYRKAVFNNYIEEVRVLNKIINQGKKVIENNEYFLELSNIIYKAYYNFKDFKNYGFSLNMNLENTKNLIRYSNIENKKILSYFYLDSHTCKKNDIVNIIGLSIGPFNNSPYQCIKKENLLDIRNIKFKYQKNDKIITITENNNGYKLFIKIIKYFIIDTIFVSFKPFFYIYHNYKEIIKLNPDISKSIIYWIYDINKDEIDIDTYENIKTNNFQEIIKTINLKLYEKVQNLLKKKLLNILQNNLNLNNKDFFQITEYFIRYYNLFFNKIDKDDIYKKYLFKKKIEKSNINSYDNKKFSLPEIIKSNIILPYKIQINTLNPNNLFINMDINKFNQNNITDIKICEHEIEWNEVSKINLNEINKYNMTLSNYFEKFVVETIQMEFVCKICGQILPIKQYVQDGSFDNNNQKFISAYLPIDIPLEKLKEYKNFNLTIKYLDALINRFSLITGNNMLIGSNIQNKQKKKSVIKNIIDLIIKHNFVNLKKNIKEEDRLEYFSKKFNIDKNLDSVYFFELNDTIFNFTDSLTPSENDINKLKYNNILLYFIIIFITELNGPQIIMMNNTKIANIYTYLKYGPKLFDKLLIKKNINDNDTVPILNYPVLCYLIFVLSYFLLEYKLWYHPVSDKNFNPIYQKIIINSFVDLFNSISIDANKNLNEYVYILTTSKLYTQLNNNFKNYDIIDKLKNINIKYSFDKIDIIQKDKINIIKLKNGIIIKEKPYKIPTFKISDGIYFNILDNLSFNSMNNITDLTNCSSGSFHNWKTISKNFQCTICGLNDNEVNGKIDRYDENYYYELNIVANKRCLDGTIHNFINKDNEIKCSKCNLKKNIIYDKKQLDTLSLNIINNDLENIQKKIIDYQNEITNIKINEDNEKKIYDELLNEFNKKTNGKYYDSMIQQSNILMQYLIDLLGFDNNIDIDKYPLYLIYNVYIIDHNHEGLLLKDPIIINQKENKIIFKEEHPFFKTDVYYYTDNKIQTDIFYHAVTLKLLGYKEKHKNYTILDKANVYLKISTSIKDKLLYLGYSSKYINIENNNNNNYEFLENLINEHILKFKSIIDKISSLIYQIKNNKGEKKNEDNENLNDNILYSNRNIETIIFKFSKLLKNFNTSNGKKIFEDWYIIKNYFFYQKINWDNVNIKITNNIFINSDIINYYDISSNIMFFYLINELIKLFDYNKEKNIQINIAQMITEIIFYIHNLYNIEKFQNSLDFKRFIYILNGSEYMIDLMKKSQGSTQSERIENQLDDSEPDIITKNSTEENEEEIEDLKEEAESLDIESDYYAEEDEDTFQEGENE